MADSYIHLSFEGITGEVAFAADRVIPGPGTDWIMLTGCELAVQANTQARAMSGGGNSRIDFGGEAPPVIVRKLTDAATTGLMIEMLLGRAPRQAVIAFTRIEADGPVEYLRYELERCTVVGFELADIGDERPTETFSLRYGQLNMITFAGGHGAKGAQSSVLLMNGG